MRVHLKIIDRSNLREILRLKVLDEERDFVALNAFSLAEAYVEEELSPRGIYAGACLVGFIMYGRWYNERSYWITRLMVSSEHRGKGYAKEAIKLAMSDLFSRKDCRRISISFVPENQSARNLYESLGFKEAGIIEDEIRYEFIR